MLGGRLCCFLEHCELPGLCELVFFQPLANSRA